MSGVIFTQPKRYSDLVKREQWADMGWCNEKVTVNVAAETALTIGSVVGKVTATGKYVPRDHAAVDGSQVAAGVVLENITVPATTDTSVLVMVDGDAFLAEESLVFDVAHDAGQKAAAVAELKALGIKTKTQLY